MTNRETLRSLADACEALSGPCRETDALILRALGRCPHVKTVAGFGGVDPRVDVCTECGEEDPFDFARYYTASIDEAMSLVPEGWQTLAVEQSHDGAEWIWRLYPQYRSDLAVFGQAGSAALALTAASLRAIGEGL